MRLTLYESPQSSVVWRVMGFGRERAVPGRHYWFDNRQRRPEHESVIQATLAGQILYRDEAGDRVSRPGSLLLFGFGEASHYGQPQRLEQPYECQWLNLQGAGLREHLNVLRRRHGSVLDVGLRSPLLRQMDEILQMVQPARRTPTLIIAGAVHQFVLALLQHAQQALDESMTPARRAVEAMLQQPHQPWSLKALADQFGCSREHLTRTFRQQTGRSPAAYLNEQKLQRALRLITQTALPMQAIAQQCGYASVHTMARQVRARTGRSPVAAREPGR
jgi:AraC-like DNA-binding protein